MVTEPAKSYDSPPRHLAALIQRIANLSEGREVTRLSRALAGVIIGQMLPGGVVKGGSAMKLRLGHGNSRFTADIDIARSQTLDDFVEGFSSLLMEGWQKFTGRLVERKPARPLGVPADYVMKPFDVKLSYCQRSWLTVEVEVGHDELGDTDEPEYRMPNDLRDLLVRLGFDEPSPIPILAVEHQIAQKLHACSEPGSERAHDLVDLQLLVSSESPDMGKTSALCKRLFASRHQHHWPSVVTPAPEWDALYQDAAAGLDVLPTVDDAARWVNDLIGALASHPASQVARVVPDRAPTPQS